MEKGLALPDEAARSLPLDAAAEIGLEGARTGGAPLLLASWFSYLLLLSPTLKPPDLIEL